MQVSRIPESSREEFLHCAAICGTIRYEIEDYAEFLPYWFVLLQKFPQLNPVPVSEVSFPPAFSLLTLQMVNCIVVIVKQAWLVFAEKNYVKHSTHILTSLFSCLKKIKSSVPDIDYMEFEKGYF
jgi:hypothetical protein